MAKARFEESTTNAKRPADETVEEIEERRPPRRTAEVGTQTEVSLPQYVSALWSCHCPEAEGVVDMTEEKAHIARTEERLEVVETPAEEEDKAATESVEALLERSTAKENEVIDWGNKEQVDMMEDRMRLIGACDTLELLSPGDAGRLRRVSQDDERDRDRAPTSPESTPMSMINEVGDSCRSSHTSWFDWDSMDISEENFTEFCPPIGHKDNPNRSVDGFGRDLVVDSDDDSMCELVDSESEDDESKLEKLERLKEMRRKPLKSSDRPLIKKEVKIKTWGATVKGLVDLFENMAVTTSSEEFLAGQAARMTGWSETMSAGMVVVWKEALNKRNLEQWAMQIDEGTGTVAMGTDPGPPPGLEDDDKMEPIDDAQIPMSYGDMFKSFEHWCGITGASTANDIPVSTFPAEEKRTATRTPVPARRIGGTRMRMGRGMTVDSGAADNVMPRRMVRGKFNKVIRQSPGSRANVH